MQTIPDRIIDRILEQHPDAQPLVDSLRRNPGQASTLERALADKYLLGETRLSGLETFFLSCCTVGDPYGARYHRPNLPDDALREAWLTVPVAAQVAGYDPAHLHRLIRDGHLPATTRNGVRWVRLGTLLERPRSSAGRPRTTRQAALPA